MTRASRSGRLRTSHFSVRSLRSGRSVPQSKYRWMSSNTSLRSPFWLTDRLGRTSHRTNRVGLGEIETVKHPSPSTNPEMYDGRSTRPCREPACCSGHRFATRQPYGWGVTATRSLVLSDSVVTGPYLLTQAEGFPRHYPPSIASFLSRQPVWASPL